MGESRPKAQVTIRGRLILGVMSYIILDLEISSISMFNKMENKIYHTVRTKSNRKIVKRGKVDTTNTEIHEHFPDISIKHGGLS